MDRSIAANFLDFQRQRIRKASEARALAGKRMDAKFAKEAAESRTILEQTLKNHRELSADELCVVTIPSGISKISPLPESRLQTYKQHLETVIRNSRGVHQSDPDETDEHRDKATAENIFENAPKLQIASEQMCGMCKGGCCTAGQDSAYITRSTIRRFLDANPDYSDADVLDAYLSRLSPETMTNACINQSPTGCVLPRSMRSDTCNNYFCKSLESWHESAASRMTDAILVIQRADSNWGSSDSHEKNAIVDVAIVMTRDESVVRYDAAMPGLK